MSLHVNVLIPFLIPAWWEELAVARYRVHAGKDTLVSGIALSKAQEEAADAGGLVGVLLENARAAERDGAMAHVVDSFGDRAMSGLSERLERPVTGVGHAAMHFAHAFSTSFSVITSEAAAVERITRNAVEYGVSARLVGCESVGIPAEEIPGRRDEAIGRMASIVGSMAPAPGMIVLGCTELAELAPRLRERLSLEEFPSAVAVINPLIVAIRWAEAAALAL